jgi:hypothetical protein
MFATVEEAEKARRVLMRHAGVESLAQETVEGWWIIRAPYTADVCPLETWDEVADIVLVPPSPPAGPRAGLLAEARAHLGSVQRGLVRPARPFGDPVSSQVAGLCAALECLLEVLA